MQDLKSPSAYLRIESVLILALGVCIFVSKPGIYASTGLLVLYALVRTTFDPAYRKQVASSRLALICIAIYLLGIVAAVIAPGTTRDLAWIARKSLFLLSFVPLYFAFQNKQNRGIGLIGLLVGFWAAAVLTLTAGNWRPEDPTRLDGATWLVDVWGVLCALFVVFLTPRVFTTQTPLAVRTALAATIAMAVWMLFLTSARGPWLGALAGILFYLVLCQRKALVLLVFLVAVAYVPARGLLPEAFHKLETKVASIVDTTGQQTGPSESNWIRLQLWKVSLAQDLEKLQQAPLRLLFGSGPENHLNEFKAFFDRTDVLSEADKNRLRQFNFPSNDVHNMYLDATAKMGVIWTASIVGLLLLLGVQGLRNPHNNAQVATTALIVSFLVIGGFYDLLGHFASFFLFFFMALSLQSDASNAQSRLSGHRA